MTYTDSFLEGLLMFFVWARWFLLAGLILTIADLKFGIDKARYRNEEIRKSRAVRRTLQKIEDYIIWIILAYTFGNAFISFEIELLPIILLFVIYGIELESIFKNYFTSRGKNIKVNILKFFGKKTDVIEIEEQEDEKCN